jgi:hypothetical protein
MQARRHIVTLWLCAAVQVVASIQPALGLNLCVADDGHRTFELAHAEPGCREEIRRHHPDGDIAGGDELTPHSCRDFSIVESRLHRLVLSQRSDAPAVVAFVAPSFEVPRAWRVDPVGRRTAPPAVRPGPDLLRNVVLVV